MENTQIKKILTVLAVILLPLIYSITYLEGFWDPYNNLAKIKVAVVNKDDCVKSCKSDELIKKLKDSNSFNFIEKKEKEAEKLLLTKKYYATITIPNDFTESFKKAESKDRKASTIIYRTNKKTNYIASQLIENAVMRVEKELDNEVSKEVVKNLSCKLNEVPEQTDKISDALNQIYTGTVALNSGATKLNEGTNTLNNSSRQIETALDKLAQGAKTINEGTNTLKNGTEKLKQGSYELQNGTQQIKDNVNSANQKINEETKNLTEGMSQIISGSNDLNSGLKEYSTKSKEILDNIKAYFENLKNTTQDQQTIVMANTYIAYINILEENSSNLTLGSDNLKQGLNSLTNKLLPALTEISDNMNTLENSLEKLNNGAIQLNNGIIALSEGVNRLDSGTKTLFDGSNEIANKYKVFSQGINTLNSSVTTLKSGTNDLENGTNEAKTKVTEASRKTKEQLKDLEGLEEYTKKPIKLQENSYGKVEDYGTFFSPFFMSLSLWLGGILIIMGLYYDPEKRFEILGKESSNRTKRLIYYGLIGLAQSVVLPIVLVLALHFTVTNWLLFFASCILIGLAFLSIMLFLVFNFDDVGKFLAIVLLVIQLAACAGTFPLETEPTFFGAISPFMPMTYSVELLRESFVNIDSSILNKDIIILLSILIIFSTLIFVTGLSKRKEK